MYLLHSKNPRREINILPEGSSADLLVLPRGSVTENIFQTLCKYMYMHYLQWIPQTESEMKGLY